VVLTLGVLAASAASAPAQGYRVRVDAQAQAVSFRGLIPDSIPAGLAVPTPGGGLETPDGRAVRCGASDHCFFWRPGGVLRAVPTSTSASVTLWGFGVQGLTAHATGRLFADLGDDIWPGTDPLAQLLEGYLQYERSALLARAGRQLVASRLEPIGFDGGWLRYRWDDASLEFTGYGGWGLARASALSVLSPALNPLDEWRPRDRQLVAGAEAAWLHRIADVRLEYRREIDPQDDYFVSERAALSLGARAAAVRVTGGLDYNIAEGHLGSADATVTYLHSRYSVSGGARRYRPYFSLWTLWSAFSPVPYHAAHVAGQFVATDRLTIHARGEVYRYEDAEVSTALVPQLEDRGWRMHTGAVATLTPRWRLDANVGLEHGPGAAGRFVDGAATYATERYSFALYGGTMARPLELRFYDATSRWIGGRADWQFDTQRRVWADVALVGDERERPDASASSLTQVRMRAGVRLSFGSDTDRMPLPPARRTGR
jgi:hypothetical protein